MSVLLKRVHKHVKEDVMHKPVKVEGVGNGQQQTGAQVVVPGSVRTEDGRVIASEYHAPVLQDSDIPALLGLRSLKKSRAVLDMINNKLHLCGQGQVRFTPPPGTRTLCLVESEWGHLLLPF
eukprot:5171382-Karenia_brevis.AAC.1